ncbi:MAG: OsmC family protein [Nocardioidaceae bacterium]
MSALEAEAPQPPGAAAVLTPLAPRPAPYECRVRARTGPDGHGLLLPVPVPDERGIDLDWQGVPSTLPGPGELLAGALATCLLTNLDRAAALLGVRYDAAEVEVTARRQDSPPRFVGIDYELRVTTEEPDRLVHVVHRNACWHGSVFNTIASVCHVDGTVVVVRP